MLVTPFGIMMLVKPVQPWNAEFPTLVTLFGIVMLLKPVRLLNAKAAMLVTGNPSIAAGMVNSFSEPLYPVTTISLDSTV